MKLAEALTNRSDIQTRLQALRGRIIANARHQDGDTPAEDPGALLAEAEELFRAHEELVATINRTNLATHLADGRTLTDALAARDVLAARRKLYADVATAAAGRSDRIMRSEIRFVSSLDVPELRRRADDVARDYRILDTAIQEANWATDLLE